MSWCFQIIACLGAPKSQFLAQPMGRVWVGLDCLNNGSGWKSGAEMSHFKLEVNKDLMLKASDVCFNHRVSGGTVVSRISKEPIIELAVQTPVRLLLLRERNSTVTAASQWTVRAYRRARGRHIQVQTLRSRVTNSGNHWQK